MNNIIIYDFKYLECYDTFVFEKLVTISTLYR